MFLLPVGLVTSTEAERHQTSGWPGATGDMFSSGAVRLYVLYLITGGGCVEALTRSPFSPLLPGGP